jgi:hypothetical protein
MGNWVPRFGLLLPRAVERWVAEGHVRLTAAVAARPASCRPSSRQVTTATPASWTSGSHDSDEGCAGTMPAGSHPSVGARWQGGKLLREAWHGRHPQRRSIRVYWRWRPARDSPCGPFRRAGAAGYRNYNCRRPSLAAACLPFLLGARLVPGTISASAVQARSTWTVRLEPGSLRLPAVRTAAVGGSRRLTMTYRRVSAAVPRARWREPNDE